MIMTDNANKNLGEELRAAMRRWVTGVSIVTSSHEGSRHGMTVNSFVSISLDPPMVTVTLNKDTRTHALVERSGRYGVTILSSEQQHLAEIFAGRVAENADRFAGVETFTLGGSSLPLLVGGLAWLDCTVVQTIDLAHATLFIGRVDDARVAEGGDALVYFNRAFHQIGA
jgi:flavin reductase (DIM6/NTAB) family NADH-FMN oxidoreductase RutF